MSRHYSLLILSSKPWTIINQSSGFLLAFQLPPKKNYVHFIYTLKPLTGIKWIRHGWVPFQFSNKLTYLTSHLVQSTKDRTHTSLPSVNQQNQYPWKQHNTLRLGFAFTQTQFLKKFQLGLHKKMKNKKTDLQNPILRQSHNQRRNLESDSQ